MVEGIDKPCARICESSMIARYFSLRQKIIHGESAKRCDEFGLQYLYLAGQVGFVGLNLFGQRVAVFRGAALDDVRNID